MAHTDKKIYIDTNASPVSGVSVYDIQAVLGLLESGVGALTVAGVSRGVINKWAKYKPIHYPGKVILEDADFRGRQVDTNDHGLVYGLKVPSQVSVIDPAAFHAVTWDYAGYPNAPGLSGTSLRRARDFNGYNKDAMPDIYGIIPATSKFYVGTEDAGIVTANSVVNEGYRQNTQGGVPLARYVVDGVTLTDNQLMARLAQCYPAILIGNYLTAVGVYNPTSGDVDYGTIVRSNGSGGWVIASDSWCVDMRKLDDGGLRPWTADTNTVATLVLVYTASSNPYLIHNDPDTDITAMWINLTGRQSDPWTARIFPLPGACGVSIQVERYITPGFTLTPVSAVGTTSQVTINFSVSYVGSSPTPFGTATVSARVGSGGLEPSTTVFLRGSVATATATFTAGQFDKMAFDPSRDTQIYVHAIANPGADTSDTLTITY